MSADPRFDVMPEQYTDTQRRRSKWASCFIGCLIVLGVMTLIAIGVGVWLYQNAGRLFADVGTQAINQIVNDSELAPQEKVEVKAQADRVAKALREGRISLQQAGQIMGKVMESPLMPTIIVMGVNASYIAKSGLTDDEKAAARVTLNRFAQGAIAHKIQKPGIDAVMAYVADPQSNGSWRLRQQVSDADLKAAVAEAKSQADKAGIEQTPPDINVADELKKIIDKEMPGN